MFNIFVSKQSIMYRYWFALFISSWIFLIIMIIAITLASKSRNKVLFNIVDFIFATSVAFLVCTIGTLVVMSKPLHQIASPRTYLSSIQYKGSPQSISLSTKPKFSDGLKTNQRIIHHQLKRHAHGVNVKVYRRYWWYKNRFDQDHFIPRAEDELGKKNYTAETKVYYVPKNVKWNEE